LLKLPGFEQNADLAFQAWVFGCLCKFHLEDSKNRRLAKSQATEEYNPQHPDL
jgi:hypothetical protein